MIAGPNIARMAALIGDPARAAILVALMDGRALTVSELAQAAGVGLSTASTHLSQLDAGGLIVARKQGRHRYFRLADAQTAHVLESLMGLAERAQPKRVRTGPDDRALREARICYDHLAGERGVGLMQGLISRGWLTGAENPALTKAGRTELAQFGIDIAGLEKGRRPLCRSCLDWSERRTHLGGALGAALLSHMVERNWARRAPSDRRIHFTPKGLAAFRTLAGEG
jgi:DNA-binding transcriptional ArsR family regulator